MGTVTTLLLCAVGLYASAFMARKAARDARGELTEPSVVQRPAARAIGGMTAGLLAAAMSLYLAYSLLFVTRMPCPYCWTSHVANWALAVLVFLAGFRSP